MRGFLHLMIVFSTLFGMLILLGTILMPGSSAVQQAAVGALVAAWVLIFHALSSMADRRWMMENQQ